MNIDRQTEEKAVAAKAQHRTRDAVAGDLCAWWLATLGALYALASFCVLLLVCSSSSFFL